MGEPKAIPRSTQSTLGPKGRKWFVDYLPITADNECELYVDGKEYCADLYTALMGAQERVFLTGLHFMADFGLIRNGSNDSDYHLAAVLAQVAKKGVKIHLIVNQFWVREAVIALERISKAIIINEGGLGSYLSESFKLFEELKNYPNVWCRTAVHANSEPIMGTNHQKTVVIDDKIAFLGGIDLTYIDGDRWDSHEHQAQHRHVDRAEKFWHDVQIRIKGPAVDFVRDNFHARWNHDTLYRLKWGAFAVQMDPDALYNPEFEGIVAERDDQVKKFGRIQLKDLNYPTHRESPFLPRVQIVRSMPKRSYLKGKQKPHWNKSEQDWERACKDAYLVGIRAAEKYIYLENQWIADEHIWEELRKAAARNYWNKHFRIVVMLPQKFLTAAGAGANQEISISKEIQAVKNAGRPDTFGMYCLVEDFDDGTKKSEKQIYVHSKIMIVDDAWSLIGSANAGGISLEGIRPGADRPDSELSAVILDEKFAKGFRKKLWDEHLGQPVSEDFTSHDADLFRGQANKGGQRVRFSGAYKNSGGVYDEYDTTFEYVKRNAKIVCARNDLKWNMPVAALPIPFQVYTMPVPPRYILWYRWAAEIGEEKIRYRMRSPLTNAIVHNYSNQSAAFVPSASGAEIDRLTSSSILQPGRILCRVQLAPIGEKPDDKNIHHRDFLVEYEVKFMNSKAAAANLAPNWKTAPKT